MTETQDKAEVEKGGNGGGNMEKGLTLKGIKYMVSGDNTDSQYFIFKYPKSFNNCWQEDYFYVAIYTNAHTPSQATHPQFSRSNRTASKPAGQLEVSGKEQELVKV